MYRNVKLAIQSNLTPFGENPIFPPTFCCTENVIGTLSNLFEKLLKCDVKCSLCKRQSAGDNVVT